MNSFLRVTENDTAQAQRARAAFRIALGGALALSILTAINFYRGLIFAGLSQSVVVLITLVCAWLSRRGRVVASMTLLLLSWLLGMSSALFLVAGQGVLFGTLAFILTAGIVLTTFPPPLVRRGVVFGVFAGVAIVLFDLLAPFTRPQTSSVVISLTNLIPLILILGVVMFRQFRHVGLGAKLATVLGGVTLVAISLLSVIVNTLTREQILRDAGASAKNAARAQALIIGDTLAQQTQQLRAFGIGLSGYLEAANREYQGSPPEVTRAKLSALDQQWRAAQTANNLDHPLLQAPLQHFLVAELAAYRRTHPTHIDLLVTDAHGAIVATTYRPPAYWLAGEEWWQAAYQDGRGSIYVGQPETAQQAALLYAPIAIPIYRTTDASVLGILRAHYRLKPLGDLLSGTRVGQTGRLELYVPNGEGWVRLERETLAPAPLNAETVKQLHTTEISHRELLYESSPRLVSAATMASLPTSPAASALSRLQWTVVFHQAQSEILTIVENQTRNMLILALFISSLVILIAFPFAQVIVKPLTRLMVAAAEISGGKLQARADIETRDEIGTLAFTFNKMAQQLQQTLTGLENRVRERTAALDKTNQTLAAENAERRHVETTLQQQTQHLSALNEVALNLIGRLDLDALLRDVLTRAGELVGAPDGYIYLVDNDRQTMQVRVATGTLLPLVGTRVERGNGIGGAVWASGAPLVVNDYQAWSGRLQRAEAEQVRAAIGVPLIARAEVIGVLGLAYSKEGGEFGESALALLQRFTPLAAIAIENARLFAETRQTLTEMDRLYQASRQLASTTTLEGIVTVMGESTLNPFVNRATLLLFERDAEGQVISGAIAARWFSGQGHPPTAPIGSTLHPAILRAGLLIDIREPVLVADVATDPRFPPMAKQQLAQAYTRCGVILPIWVGNKHIASLNMIGESPHEFTSQETRVYFALMQQVSLAVENIRLIEQTRQALAQAKRLAQRAQIVTSVSEKLRQATDVRRIIRLTAQETQRVTEGSRVLIRLYPVRVMGDSMADADGKGE
jgi:GAF domain-containing protein/HAMP domain-containing protein